MSNAIMDETTGLDAAVQTEDKQGTQKTRGGLARYWPILLIGTGAVLAFIYGRDFLSFEALRDNREALIAWRDGNLVLALAVFMGLYALVVAFSIPGALWMTLGGGFLFGVVTGTIATVVAATVGAMAIFLAARTSLGVSLKERAGPWLAKLETGVQENEASYMLLLRLVPAVPFFIANLAPAFLGVSTRTYLWTTLVGIIPATAVYSWVGSGLGDVIDRGDTPNLGLLFEPQIIGPLLGIAALAALPIVIKAVRGRKSDGETAMDETAKHANMDEKE